MGESCLSYSVDRNDRITDVSQDWECFARDNQGSGLAAPLVIGKSLFKFISNPDTQEVYRMLMIRVRTSCQPLSFPYRCDAPDRRRFLQMDISPLRDNGLRFDSCIVREETREPVALLDVNTPRSSKILIVCSWCKKVRLPEGYGWVEVEDAVDRLGLFDAARLPMLSHAICPHCRNVARDVSCERRKGPQTSPRT